METFMPPVQTIAPQIGRESKVFAKGQYWTVGRFEVDEWEELLKWAAPRILNPLEDLRAIVDKLPPEVALQLIRETLDKRPVAVTIDNPAVHFLIESKEGKVHLFWLLLRKHHPDITKQQVFDILLEVGEIVQAQALEQAAGKPPPRPKSSGTNGNGHAALARGNAVAQDYPVLDEPGPSLAVANPQADAG
jgi:hypothetical protein